MKRDRSIGKVINSLSILIVFISMSIQAWSQQDPVYTQYMNNLMSVNPAYTAVRGVGSFSGIFRNQWVNLEGAPKSTSLTFSMPVDSFHMGLGVDFLYDYTIPLSTSELYLNYSYKIKLADSSFLSFGLKAGVDFLEARLSRLDRYHLDDEYILGYGDFNRLFFNTGIGVFWYNERFYAGLSIPRLLENQYNRDVTTVKAASREKQHYFLHGACTIDLSPKVKFKPGLTTIMTAGAPVTADFDFSFLFYKRVWFGMMYRISDAVGAYTQLQINDNFKLGFSYDYSHTRIHEFQAGTFEFMLRYDFKTKKSQTLPPYSF